MAEPTMDNVLIIAEAGVNHNGSLEMAEQLVDAAAEAGADIVKFQTFKAARIASRSAGKAEYQKRTTAGGESQLDMLTRLELDETAHRILAARCADRRIEFLSTPFDLESVDLLGRIGVARLKVPSGELTNGPLLFKMAASGLPLVVSTGMATLEEIREALAVIQAGYFEPNALPTRERLDHLCANFHTSLGRRVTLLHCTTEYPCPLDEVNLRAMDTLRSTFGLPVGYSDHTEGITVSIAAAARGATVIEKHFTLDRNLPGPDHKASLEPAELRSMVAAIREIEKALGRGEKQPTTSEAKNRSVARKSIVASRSIAKGEQFSLENLTTKRPGTGVPAMQFWDYLGKTASRDYAEDELIDAES